jgi:hypothetical protein
MFLSDTLEGIDGIVLNKRDMEFIDAHMEIITRAASGLTGLQKVLVLMQIEEGCVPEGDSTEVREFLINGYYSGCIVDGITATTSHLSDKISDLEEFYREKIKQCSSKQQRSSQG